MKGELGRQATSVLCSLLQRWWSDILCNIHCRLSSVISCCYQYVILGNEAELQAIFIYGNLFFLSSLSLNIVTLFFIEQWSTLCYSPVQVASSNSSAFSAFSFIFQNFSFHLLTRQANIRLLLFPKCFLKIFIVFSYLVTFINFWVLLHFNSYSLKFKKHFLFLFSLGACRGCFYPL